MAVEIVRWTADEVEARADDLVAILRACLDDGASISFLQDTTDEDLRAYWSGVADEIRGGSVALLAALADDRLLGTVHVGDAPMPNGRHRAEVRKLLVAPSVRRGGVGSELMRQVEPLARERGRWLLVLDTETGSGAQALYRGLGWTEAGAIPLYAAKPDGVLIGTTLFWKDLRAAT